MMRIVCPVCGEEPKKGQRHICAASVPSASPVVAGPPPHSREEPTSGTGALQRRGLNATPSTVCASIASLVQKSPGLWRSTSALARCGGEAFVAGLLATAIGSVSWAKDPKGALIAALAGRVADEAARAIQVSWRRRFCARLPQHPVKRDGYHQLALVAPKTVAPQNRPAQRVPHAPCAKPDRMSNGGSGGGRTRPPPLSVVLPRNDGADQVAATVAPPALQSPSGQSGGGTPRNKSNPRPGGTRAVPMNPIQALKQRKAQQEKDAEERRMEQLIQAEECRVARAREASGSVPSTPQGTKALTLGGVVEDSAPSTADTEAFDGSRMLAGRAPSGPSTPRASERFGEGTVVQDAWQEPPGISANSMEGVLTPFERRALRQASPRGPKPPLPDKPPHPASFADLVTIAPYVAPWSAPTTLEQWRPTTANGLDLGCEEIPRASTSTSPSRPSAQRGELTATTRLRERMRQREGLAAAPRAHSPLGFGGNAAAPRAHSPMGTSSWQSRIEARQREAVELQEIEAQQKQQTEERCYRRNDVLRKVMQRQAQRQQEVEGLQED